MRIRWVDACDPSSGDPDIYVCVRPDGTQQQCTGTEHDDSTPTFNWEYTWSWEVSEFRLQTWDKDDWLEDLFENNGESGDDERSSETYSQSSLFSGCSSSATSCVSSKSMSNIEGCYDEVYYTIEVFGYNTPSPTSNPTEPSYGLDICIYSDDISDDYEPFVGKWVRNARDGNGYNYWRQVKPGIVDDNKDYYMFYDTTNSRLYGIVVANFLETGDELFHCGISGNVDPTACDGNWYFATYVGDTLVSYTLHSEVRIESCYLVSMVTDCDSSAYHSNMDYNHVCLDNMKYQTHLLEGTYVHQGCNNGFRYYYNSNANKFMYFSLSDGKYLISNNTNNFANESDAYCPSTDIMDCSGYLYECDADDATGECDYTLANDPLIDNCARGDICVYGKSLIDDEYESYAGRYKYNATNEYWQHIDDISIILTRDSIVGVTTIPGDTTSSVSLLCTDSGTSDATQCGNWSYSAKDGSESHAGIGVEFCHKLENDTDCSFTSSETFNEICIRHLTYQSGSIEGSYTNNSCVNGFQQYINADATNPSSIVFDLDYGRLSVLDSSSNEMGYCYSTSILDCDYDNFYEYDSSQSSFTTTTNTRIINCAIPTKSPTTLPTQSPTDAPTPPTPKPTRNPTPPTPAPTKPPTATTSTPTVSPSNKPSLSPTDNTPAPTDDPTIKPTLSPTLPSQSPTYESMRTTQSPAAATGATSTVLLSSTVDGSGDSADNNRNGTSSADGSALTEFVEKNKGTVISVGILIATLFVCGCVCACCVHLGACPKDKRRKYLDHMRLFASISPRTQQQNGDDSGANPKTNDNEKKGDQIANGNDNDNNNNNNNAMKENENIKEKDKEKEKEKEIEVAVSEEVTKGGSPLPMKIAKSADTAAIEFIINGDNLDALPNETIPQEGEEGENYKDSNSDESDEGEIIIDE